MPKTKATKAPLALLTLRRISEVTGEPVSRMEQVLDEHPEIQPAAVADFRPVYDRNAFLQLLAVIDQADPEQETAGV